MTEQMRLFDDTELLPLFALCPTTVEVDPFESPRPAENPQPVIDLAQMDRWALFSQKHDELITEYNRRLRTAGNYEQPWMYEDWLLGQFKRATADLERMGIEYLAEVDVADLFC